tara:strand:+ start:1502 stop:2956 length:1455 start_codon:yes stop_codon:yes gene_type:complete
MRTKIRKQAIKSSKIPEVRSNSSADLERENGKFYSKDKDSQRYLLSLYANEIYKEIKNCKFAYLDSPDLAATKYFIKQCPNVDLFPINMQNNDKERADFQESKQIFINNKQVIPLEGDIVSVLYDGSKQFNIIWLDWCATYQSVASFNDFIKVAHAFEQNNCVLAVTLSTRGIRDTIEGSVTIPGQKVLRWLHFLLNTSTGMGFHIKTSTVYPGKSENIETPTRMVFLIATIINKKDLKLPTDPKIALKYGEHIGKELLIPIKKVWPEHNANDDSFRKYLIIHDHIIARVYNARVYNVNTENSPLIYYVQYKPLCSDWINDPDNHFFTIEKIEEFSSLFNKIKPNDLSLLCQAKVEGNDKINIIDKNANIKLNKTKREVEEAGFEDGVEDFNKESRPWGEELVDNRVKVWWGGNKKWFAGKVAKFDNTRNNGEWHYIMYDDGEEKWHNLYEDRWKLDQVISTYSSYALDNKKQRKLVKSVLSHV